MQRIPSDLALDIACRFASEAKHTMHDLASLRAMCTEMRRVVLRARRWEPYCDSEERWETLTHKLARHGNPGACFLTGLKTLFFEHHDTNTPPRVDMLRRAADGGHQSARYVVAVVLFRMRYDTANDDEARRLLREVEGEESSSPKRKNDPCTHNRLIVHQIMQSMRLP
ncbi:hypothetical protein BDA96_04G148200 [Sorghum bicolor]|uniref:At2g35280-like TPR domain-containing protein n=1 Tax=Sorghum bicolor TaxID=4558 RepID=A0A921R3T6_SORBI|nr:hypothetical protein BDA96_04G148200 [Sorghum bicolor]